MSYMIHSCKDRYWYVKNYLIPSMLEQGIKKNEIDVYVDKRKEGNLVSWCKSILQLKETGATWHLQDDVVISKWFTSKTSEYHGMKQTVVCGFCSKYDKPYTGKFVNPENMWYSFLCIRIPNHMAYEFLDWFDTVAKTNYKHCIDDNKHDDLLFKNFLQEKYSNILVEHLNPNIVNHIDYLIGGSKVNPYRNGETITSLYWDDKNTVYELEQKIKKYGKKGK